jgi:hypothetical protein
VPSQEIKLTALQIRWAFLAVIYAVFFVWYGGSGDPISPEKALKYMARFDERNAEGRAEGRGPDRGDFDFLANMRQFMETDDGQEFVMLNLNVYRDAPEYRDDVDGSEAIASAAAAEDEYQRRVAPLLFSRACHPLVMVEPALFLGGTGDFERQDWSLASMVRYRSRQDFVEFILSPEFSQDVDHKWAALSRSTSMATVPVISFATIRLLPLSFLIIVGLLLDRIGARSR